MKNRIIFGVNSEGMGHAMRSAELIKELSRKYNVDILTGGNSANYLETLGNLKRVNYLSFVTKNGNVKYFRTALLNLIKFPFMLYNFITLFFTYLFNRPKFIVTDFEPISSYLALFLGLPLISFDNQHIVTDTKVKETGSFISRLIYKTTVYLMVPFPWKKIVTTFFYPKVSNKNTKLVPPIVRKIITDQKIENKDHFLVYLSLGDDNLLKELDRLNQKCLVYGKTDLKSTKNIKIKDFDKTIFAKDLAESKGVISNAGMTTLTEAIYLKKPIFSIPLKGHVEQELNAFYIQKEGFGLRAEEVNKKTIKEFIQNLKKYKNNLKSVKFTNQKTIKTILKEIHNSIS